MTSVRQQEEDEFEDILPTGPAAPGPEPEPEPEQEPEPQVSFHDDAELDDLESAVLGPSQPAGALSGDEVVAPLPELAQLPGPDGAAPLPAGFAGPGGAQQRKSPKSLTRRATLRGATMAVMATHWGVKVEPLHLDHNEHVAQQEGTRKGKTYVPSKARWGFVSHELEKMGLKPSKKSAIVTAKFQGLDRIGHGFAGWQAPLTVMTRLFSTIWSLGALMDGFGQGQLSCELANRGVSGPLRCERQTMAELLALNRTSVYPGTTLEMWRPVAVSCATPDEECVEPGWVRSRIVGALLCGALALTMLLDGMFRRPQLRPGGIKANRAAIGEMFAVLVMTIATRSLLKSAQTGSIRAFGRLQALAEAGDPDADFDPMAAASYAR